MNVFVYELDELDVVEHNDIVVVNDVIDEIANLIELLLNEVDDDEVIEALMLLKLIDEVDEVDDDDDIHLMTVFMVNDDTLVVFEGIFDDILDE